MAGWWVQVVVASAVMAVEVSGHISPSDYRQSFSPGKGYTMYWSIEGEHIRLGLEVATLGWVGWGIGERGSASMAGADIVVCAHGTGEGQVTDMYATGFVHPETDDGQDWELLSSAQADGNTTCELRRLLDPRSPHEDRGLDRAKTTEEMILFAFASAGSDELHYHEANRYNSMVDLFASNAAATLQVKLDNLRAAPDYGGSFDLLNQNHLLTTHTEQRIANKFLQGKHGSMFDLKNAAPYAEYLEVCHSASSGKGVDPRHPEAYETTLARGPNVELMSLSASIIAIEPIMDNRTREFVHHFVVFGYPDSDCSKFHERGFMYVWSHGSQILVAPDGTGFNIGERGKGVGKYRSLMIQTHFDNPRSVPNMRDNSGVRIHYAKPFKLRPMEIGILQLGDPFVALRGKSIPIGYSNIVFECDKATTNKMLWQTDGGIHVLAESLHMHKMGALMKTEVIRNNEVVKTVATEYFNWNFNGLVSDPYIIKRGDTIRTTCAFHNTEKGHVYGLGTGQEMCIDFMLYYPKFKAATKHSGGCGYVKRPTTLLSKTDVASIGRVFGAKGPQRQPKLDRKLGLGVAPAAGLTDGGIGINRQAGVGMSDGALEAANAGIGDGGGSGDSSVLLERRSGYDQGSMMRVSAPAVVLLLGLWLLYERRRATTLESG